MSLKIFFLLLSAILMITTASAFTEVLHTPFGINGYYVTDNYKDLYTQVIINIPSVALSSANVTEIDAISIYSGRSFIDTPNDDLHVRVYRGSSGNYQLLDEYLVPYSACNDDLGCQISILLYSPIIISPGDSVSFGIFSSNTVGDWYIMANLQTICNSYPPLCQFYEVSYSPVITNASGNIIYAPYYFGLQLGFLPVTLYGGQSITPTPTPTPTPDGLRAINFIPPTRDNKSVVNYSYNTAGYRYETNISVHDTGIKNISFTWGSFVFSNLVLNPSVESGISAPLNWNKYTESAAPIWDNTNSHTGTKSIKITGATPSDSGYYLSDYIPVFPSHNYTFSAWVKTDNITGSSSPTFRAKQYDSNHNQITQSTIYFSQGTYDWISGTKDITTNSNTVYIALEGDLYNGNGTFWFDDVSLMDDNPSPQIISSDFYQNVSLFINMNESTATAIKDMSRFHTDGFTKAGYTNKYIINNIFGRMLDFDGTVTTQDLGVQTNLKMNNNMSLIANVCNVDNQGDEETIIAQGGALPARNYEFIVKKGKLSFYHGNGSAVEYRNSLLVVSDPYCHSVGLSVDNNINITFYDYNYATGQLNTETQTLNASLISTDNSDHYQISSSLTGSCPGCLFKGQLGNIFLSNTAMTSDDFNLRRASLLTQVNSTNYLLDNSLSGLYEGLYMYNASEWNSTDKITTPDMYITINSLRLNPVSNNYTNDSSKYVMVTLGTAINFTVYGNSSFNYSWSGAMYLNGNGTMVSNASKMFSSEGTYIINVTGYNTKDEATNTIEWVIIVSNCTNNCYISVPPDYSGNFTSVGKNDQIIINMALNRVGNYSGTVHLLNGIFKTWDETVIQSDNENLDGYNAVIQLQGEASGISTYGRLSWNNPLSVIFNSHNNISLKNIRIDGNQTHVYAKGLGEWTGIASTRHADKLTLYNLTIVNTSDDCILIAHGNVTVKNINENHCGHSGIFLYGTGDPIGSPRNYYIYNITTNDSYNAGLRTDAVRDVYIENFISTFPLNSYIMMSEDDADTRLFTDNVTIKNFTGYNPQCNIPALGDCFEASIEMKGQQENSNPDTLFRLTNIRIYDSSFDSNRVNLGFPDLFRYAEGQTVNNFGGGSPPTGLFATAGMDNITFDNVSFLNTNGTGLAILNYNGGHFMYENTTHFNLNNVSIKNASRIISVTPFTYNPPPAPYPIRDVMLEGNVSITVNGTTINYTTTQNQTTWYDVNDLEPTFATFDLKDVNISNKIILSLSAQGKGLTESVIGIGNTASTVYGIYKDDSFLNWIISMGEVVFRNIQWSRHNFSILTMPPSMIIFSNSTDYNETITDSPLNKTLFVTTIEANESSGMYHLDIYYPDGSLRNSVTLNPLGVFSKFQQTQINFMPADDYGNYSFRLIDFGNSLQLSNNTILIYNDSYFHNPGYEMAAMYVSNDEVGLNAITAAQPGTWAYIQYTHPNGNYTANDYNISFIKPDGSVFGNVSVAAICCRDNGFIPWYLPDVLGKWEFKFIKTNLTDNNETILSNTSLTIANQTLINLSVLSGYVKDYNTSVPLIGASVIAVKGYTLSANTNNFGYYIIPDILDGNYTVMASKTGYNSASGNITMLNGTMKNYNFFLTCSGICPTPTPTPSVTETPYPEGTTPIPPSNDDLGTDFFNGVFAIGCFLIVGFLWSFFDKK